jgi:cellulose synthase/poly-beta-1,6-N-acetylglucosamine synthase-like glycosyltransferase
MSPTTELVSVIIPCYNEEATIAMLLEAIAGQDYPMEQIEIIIADGMSEDRTRVMITEFARRNPEMNIRVVDNPKRIIPAALNTAVEHSNGEYIIRLDAHSIPRPDYILNCVDLLQNDQRANVGGVWEIKPGKSDFIARGIAAAASHPLGAGGVRYRVGGSPGPVDTVPFGAFRRSWIERVGKFNEALLTNEDYEYNVRIRNAGGQIFFDPGIQSIYIARSSLPDLARQYWRYGYWKAQMLVENPGSVRIRQLIPPAFVLSSLVLALLIPFTTLASMVLSVVLSAYAMLLLLSTLFQVIVRSDGGLLVSLPLAIMLIHISWGTAFLIGLVHIIIRLVGHGKY